MACGTVINTVSFIGSNYLARYLSGDDPQAPLKKKKDTTKLLNLTKLLCIFVQPIWIY